jgi:hypothetical protein
MTGPNGGSRSYPVEEFLQALMAQLDRAQDGLAMKARTGRPLTWALKDLSIDLRVFLDVDGGGKVLLRSAGPNEDGASTVHFSLTTITRPMIEENTWSMQDDDDPRPVDDLHATARFDDADRRRLEWAGVRTVGQLKRLSAMTPPTAMESMIGIPVGRLQAALEAAARPALTGHDLVAQASGRPLLRLHGVNLSDGTSPEVRLAGTPVEVLEARPNRLLVRPQAHHIEGQVEVLVGGERATSWFRMPQPPAAAPAAVPAAAPAAIDGHGANGGGA